jgi:superfamily I DNA/RNA helicase
MGTFKPSPYQQAIFDWIENGAGNAVVDAVAGSGKTTTIVQAAKLLPRNLRAAFVAFNNHIVQELNERLAGTSVRATTLHSAGRAALARYSKVQGSPDTRKYKNIAKEWVQNTFPYLNYTTQGIYTSALNDFANYARLTLTNINNVSAMLFLAARFRIVIDDEDPSANREALLSLLPGVEWSLNQGALRYKNAGLIDFTDMIYLPIRLGIPMEQSEFIFADEIQDFNAAQLELVMKMVGGRFLGVGDPYQSIMGFAGADTESFWKIKERTNATVLPLSVCYRCPRSHIELAQTIVSHIEPAPTAKQGVIVRTLDDGELFTRVKLGDLILCRKTAPLVSACIALIGKGFPARVRGRDVSKQLTDLVQTVAKLDGFKMKAFVDWLAKYRKVQVDYLASQEDTAEQVENLIDRCEAVKACYERFKSATPEELCEEIKALFSDDNPGVWLSTIHRAKGLEADRVMILQYNKLPLVWKNQRSEELEQEYNLKYVAITRAKKELILFGVAEAGLDENDYDYRWEGDDNFYPFDTIVYEVPKKVVKCQRTAHELRFQRNALMNRISRLDDVQRAHLARIEFWLAEMGLAPNGYPLERVYA